MNESNHLQFFDGKLFKVMNYIYWIFMSSTLFLLSNILLVFSVYAVVLASQEAPLSIYHLIMIGIFAIPLGPSLASMYVVMSKIVQTQEVSVIKDYIKGYRQHFIQSSMISFILFFFYLLSVGQLCHHSTIRNGWVFTFALTYCHFTVNVCHFIYFSVSIV